MPAGSEHPAGVQIQQEGPRGEQEEQTEVSSGLGPAPDPGGTRQSPQGENAGGNRENHSDREGATRWHDTTPLNPTHKPPH
ncbi:unnamed protein product [Boreogadus saida]